MDPKEIKEEKIEKDFDIKDFLNQNQEAGEKKKVEEAAKEDEPEKPEKPIINEEPEKPDEKYKWENFGEGVDSFDKANERFTEVNTRAKSLDEKEGLWEKERLGLIEESKKNKSKIDDPTLYRLNHLKKEKPDDFKLFSRLVLNPEEVNSFELLKMDFIKDNPNYKDSPEKVEKYLKNKYDLNLVPLDAEDEDITEVDKADRLNQIEINKMKVEVDGDKVKNNILDSFNKIEIESVKPEKTEDEINKENKILDESWNPITDKLADEFKERKIYVQGVNDKEPREFVSFEVPEEYKKGISAKIRSEAVRLRMPLNKENLTKLANMVMGDFETKYQYQMNHTLMEKARTMNEEEWMKITTNSSASMKEKNIDEKDKSDYDKFMDQVTKSQ